MSVGIVTVTIGSWMVFETFSYTILTLQVFFSSCSLVSSSGPNLHLSSTGKTHNSLTRDPEFSIHL